ncbi:AfsR/SARP family transcriptional regulator [Sciscionella marina]|uniref:AfsR/SARP family transcriptional regulator n=1 Tax=Sciscionella marina TaxID=508770 RepID=UPI0003829074|nr:BTAD domain-containing putative transcriptional regulator [Sciscionella marina]
MKFEVLGPVRVRAAGADVPIGGRLRRRLLAVLLVHPDEPVPAEMLQEILWGDRAGPQRLQLQVHRLRAALGDEAGLLSHEPGGYRLRVQPGELDAAVFERLVAEAGESGDPDRSARLLDKALRLWHGTPYQDVDLPVLAGEIERLSECRLLAVEEYYGAQLRRGRHAEIVGGLADLVRAHPLRERLHGLLMVALHHAGRQGEALKAYRAARAVLVAELGVEPSSFLRSLHRRLLSGETAEPAGRALRGVTPAQLPLVASGFAGRAAELAQLDRHSAADGGFRPIAVIGTAGVGKTALVIRWGHRVRHRFPDGQLYVDLRGYGPDPPVPWAEALAGFLRALGVDPSSIPPDGAERAARLRTLVHDKRILLILDNAHDAGQVRPLLPGTPTCLAVITSRDALAGLTVREGVDRMPLGTLTVEDAGDLLTEQLPDHDSGELRALVRSCVRLPLALRIAAERLRTGPALDDLVAELDDEQARLDALETGDDPNTSVRAVLAASYRHLDPATAHLFRLFGLHPGNIADLRAIAALHGEGEPKQLRRQVEALVRAHLVEVTAERRYRLHDLLWSYAAELAAADPPEHRRVALGRLLQHYVGTAAAAARFIAGHEFDRQLPTAWAPPTYEAALSWLDAERTNLVRVAAAAARYEFPETVADLARVLFAYLDLGWHFDEARELYGLLRTVARNHLERGIAARGLGLVAFREGRLTEAESCFRDALAEHEQAGDPAPLGLTLNCLGIAAGFSGRSDQAIVYLRRSLDLYREHGPRPSMHRPLVNLGLLCRRTGRLEAAASCLREALTVAEENGHRPGVAQALYGLTCLCRDTRQYDEALEHGYRAVETARRCGFRFLEGLALNRLGTVYRCLHDQDQASACHQEALSLARTTANPHLEVMSLNAIADTHAASGADAEAATCYTEVLRHTANGEFGYERARAYEGLGDLHSSAGDPDLAAGQWNCARSLYRGLDQAGADRLEDKLAEGEG